MGREPGLREGSLVCGKGAPGQVGGILPAPVLQPARNGLVDKDVGDVRWLPPGPRPREGTEPLQSVWHIYKGAGKGMHSSRTWIRVVGPRLA